MQGLNIQKLSVGRFELDRVRNRLVGADGEIEISPLACRFLEVLANTPGELVRRETLVDRLWDGNALVGEPALNRLVSELRKAAGDDPKSPELVQTIPRRGYRLVAPAAAAKGPASSATRIKRLPGWIIPIMAAVLCFGAMAVIVEWLAGNAIGLEWMRSQGH